MSRWYEGAEESAFKTVPGGYVAQLPRSGLFLGPRGNYFVNEAQKSEIVAALRHRRRLMLASLFAILPLSAGLGLLVGFLAHHGYALLPLWVCVGALLLLLFVFAAFMAVTAYALRPLRPLIATLPRAEERITLNEQVQTVARVISGKVLALGLICGPAVVLSNILMIVHSLSGGGLQIMALWNALAGLGGALLTGYFVWLTVLRCQTADGHHG